MEAHEWNLTGVNDFQEPSFKNSDEVFLSPNLTLIGGAVESSSTMLNQSGRTKSDQPTSSYRPR